MPEESNSPAIDYARLHLRFGWGALLLFTTLGLALETLHGFKVQAYLNASNETRRLMWRLAHAHGTLLSLLNIVLALTLRAYPAAAQHALVPSRCLRLATVLMPLGFFLGGVVTYGGDPGLGVLLVPVGAAFLLIAIARLFHTATRGPADESELEKSAPRTARPRSSR